MLLEPKTETPAGALLPLYQRDLVINLKKKKLNKQLFHRLKIAIFIVKNTK